VRAIVFSGAGGPEVMSLEERPDPDPGSNEVVVASSHAGLNPADLAQRAGHYPAPPGAVADIPGLEVAGSVVTVGRAVTGWEVGDRVFGIVGGGGLADRVAVHERHVARVPDRLSDEQAAAVPEAFITAHDAIFTRARLVPGETLLVNGANGGVGTAAVQLGLAAGARVLANVRNDNARERLSAMGADPVALEDVHNEADVVLELIGSPNLAGDFRALRTKGRIIVVGSGAGSEYEGSLRPLMGKRASLMGTVLRARPMEEKGAAVQAFARSVVPLLAEGRVTPPIDRVFPAEQAVDALDHLAAPGKFGKVLLQFA
jgi:NADPH:quinone reductase-like Zn-dependent oxidoreductase